MVQENSSVFGPIEEFYFFRADSIASNGIDIVFGKKPH